MNPTETPKPPTTSPQVRARLAEALSLDLIGPWAQHELAEERLPGWVRPSNWYLTGFLVPSGTKPEQGVDGDEDGELDETPASGGLAEESSEERKAAKRGFFPSSIGLSFLVDKEAQALSVTLRWGLCARGGRGRRRQAAASLAAMPARADHAGLHRPERAAAHAGFRQRLAAAIH